MAIVSLIHPHNPITGGHRYNAHLEDSIEAQTGTSILRFSQPFYRYHGIKKAFSPVLELRLLRSIHKGDLVLFSDTTYLHHFLLLWICQKWIGCHTAIVVHHFTYLEFKGLKRKWLEHLQDTYFRMAERIIVPSPYTRDIAEQKFGQEKVVYIPLPFTTEFKTSESYTENRLLYVGTIEPRKGVHFFPDILQSVRDTTGRDVSLVMVGKVIDKAYWAGIEKRFSDMHLLPYVQRLESVPYEELSQLYDGAEAFVFPSQLEGYGMVLIEAMRHGLPIVAFDNTAMPYSIHHMENGLLAPNKDTDSFGKCVSQIIGNRALRDKLQSGMRTHIQQLKTEADFQQAITFFLQDIHTKL